MLADFFSIPVLLPELDVLTFLSVERKENHYQMEVLGDSVVLEMNGQNSWKLLSGDVSPETVEAIGAAIEEHYLNKKN